MKRGGSLLIEVHGWRGIGRDRDLFWFHVRLGFASLVIERAVMTDKMRDWKEKLKRLGEVLQ